LYSSHKRSAVDQESHLYRLLCSKSPAGKMSCKCASQSSSPGLCSRKRQCVLH